MEMRLEKNNCNLLRKTRNFYSVTPRLQLLDFGYLLKGGGYSETEKSQSAKISDNFHFRGGGGVF